MDVSLPISWRGVRDEFIPAVGRLVAGDHLLKRGVFVCSQVGPVTSVRVVRDAVTRASKGYAYVNFDTTGDTGAGESTVKQPPWEG